MNKLVIISLLCCAAKVGAEALPPLNESFETAKAYTKDQLLVVSTGEVERQWRWTGKGLATVKVVDSGGNELAGSGSQCDWSVTDEERAGRLVSLKAFRDDDEKFTDEHLAVDAEIDYGNLQVKYVIWAYPGAPGLRTQLWLKSSKGINSLGDGVSEELTLLGDPVAVTAWGYRAGLKSNEKDYRILVTEDVGPKGKSEKTNGLIVDLGGRGLVLVKESHAHMEMPKTKTEIGIFRRDNNLLQVTGLGMLPDDVSSDYKFCWANWMIPYEGGEIDAQLALKRFDRCRFPVHPDRDVFIMANTWGSEDAKAQCKYKAREENVLREIKSCANLGVDLLQIDDGWQQDKKWLPIARQSPKNRSEEDKHNTDEVDADDFVLLNGETIPSVYDVYPNGFGKVRAAAKAAGIKLGLWFAWKAPLDDILEDMRQGDFKAIKFDFANLTTKSAFDTYYYKGREVVKFSDYTAVVDWDTTESRARSGFYFGRDCGNIYLENRKAATVRRNVLYDPWQVLRDAWMLTKYVNINKFQLPFQNKDYVPEGADTSARDYPHDYNLAITLMASPIIFVETQMLSDEAVGVLKPMIAKYKAEREAMYQGYVFSLGAMPDNKSWTGLQNHNPETGKGYLLIFRELENREPKSSMALHFIKPGANLTLTNIQTGETSNVTVNEKSELNFEIPQAPGYLFLKYEYSATYPSGSHPCNTSAKRK